MQSNCLLPFYHYINKKDCINSIICQNSCDDNKDICNDCYALFGKWRNGPSILRKVDQKQICPLCLNETDCYYRPSCNHFLCVRCFKKFLFGIQPIKPIFPYKNKEKDIEYFKHDKIVQQYLKDLSEYTDYIEKTSEFSAKCYQCSTIEDLSV